jgi:hypothetical protein
MGRVLNVEFGAITQDNVEQVSECNEEENHESVYFFGNDSHGSVLLCE